MMLKQKSKPASFGIIQESEVLKKAQKFLPQFITETDRILSDPSVAKQHKMDINIDPLENHTENLPQEGQINMVRNWHSLTSFHLNACVFVGNWRWGV